MGLELAIKLDLGIDPGAVVPSRYMVGVSTMTWTSASGVLGRSLPGAPRFRCRAVEFVTGRSS
jgi:hypothetical protein